MTDSNAGRPAAAARVQAVNAANAAAEPIAQESWKRIRRALGHFPYLGLSVPMPDYDDAVTAERLAAVLERIGAALQDGAARASKEADEADRLRRVMSGGRRFIQELLPDLAPALAAITAATAADQPAPQEQ